MPTYAYRRADGSTFEIEQRITEGALTACPTTGQDVTRVITGGVGLVFKGSGFYVTDYVRKGANGREEKSTASSPSTSSSSETSSETSSKTSSKSSSDTSEAASSKASGASKSSD